jgi:hypothetical protein
MRLAASVLSAMVLVAPLAAATSESRAFTGTISDSMCVRDHAAMNVDPVEECVRECIRHSKDVKYVLLHGEHAYTLSDQETPAKFAGQKVTVKGVLYTKTNVIKVESIEAAK